MDKSRLSKSSQVNKTQSKDNVRVPQTQIRRDSAHIAHPTITAKSSRPSAAAAADCGRNLKVRQLELVVSTRGRFGFGPACHRRTGRVPPNGRRDVAAAHGRRRGGGDVFDHDDLGHVYHKNPVGSVVNGDVTVHTMLRSGGNTSSFLHLSQEMPSFGDPV